MSGKLKILPHKRWNVWNQDNVEKVLRDERIDRESKEAQKVREKRLLQETSYSHLTDGGTKHTPLLDGFGIESLRNADHEMEAKELEAKKRKRDGTAAWALGGQGAGKQWYDKSRCLDDGSRVSRGEELGKNALDPMARFLEYGGKTDHKDAGDIPSRSIGDNPSQSVDMAALRARRLDREKRERRREAGLMVGLMEEGIGGGGGYSQQYHPEISRQQYHRGERR